MMYRVWGIITVVNKKIFVAPCYGWGSTASRLESLRGGSLLFTIKYPEIHGTHNYIYIIFDLLKNALKILKNIPNCSFS